MYADLSQHDTLVASELAEKYFPDRPQTKVPLAINLALITRSAEHTTLLAANVGGDSDSVAFAGSLRPGTVNQTWFRVVQSVNGNDLVEIAQALAELRC